MGKKRAKNVGTQRMQELGYTPVQIWLDPAERARMEEAAEKENRKLATWVRIVAARAAGIPQPRA